MNKTLQKAAILASVYAMAMGINNDAFGVGSEQPVRRKEEDLNCHKKCFNPSCDLTRSGNNLYCSKECCVEHKKSKK